MDRTGTIPHFLKEVSGVIHDLPTADFRHEIEKEQRQCFPDDSVCDQTKPRG
jgi:hypothetical protein